MQQVETRVYFIFQSVFSRPFPLVGFCCTPPDSCSVTAERSVKHRLVTITMLVSNSLARCYFMFLQGLYHGWWFSEAQHALVLRCGSLFEPGNWYSLARGSTSWLGWNGSDCRDRMLSCVCLFKLAMEGLDIAYHVWGFVFWWCFFFSNLHFLNYSKSCQVHINNRKRANTAVILKTHLIWRNRNTDGIKLVWKLFLGGRGEVNQIIRSRPPSAAGSRWLVPWSVGEETSRPLNRTRSQIQLKIKLYRASNPGVCATDGTLAWLEKVAL